MSKDELLRKAKELKERIVVDSLPAATSEQRPVQVWQPEAAVTGQEYFDLSVWLPPVGHQSLRDCAAWASAYYLRSYLWARRSGQRPVSDERRFSPTFVYNQLVKNEDKGSHIVDALGVLSAKGAAPWSVAPYHERFTEKPGTEQFAAARAHTIHKYWLIASREGVLSALSQGLPVIVHVITDAEFNSGRYSVYDTEIRREARARQQIFDTSDLAHGRHAMLVVGYDPNLCAFKLVNSWGPDWGIHDGFTWVDCRLFDVIQRDPDGVNFVQEAFVVTEWSDEGAASGPGPVTAGPAASTPTPTPIVPDGPAPMMDAESETLLAAAWLRANDLSDKVPDGPTRRWRLDLVGDVRLSLRSATLDKHAGCIRRPQRYECDFEEGMRGTLLTDVEVRLAEGRSTRHEVNIELGMFEVRPHLRLRNTALPLVNATRAKNGGDDHLQMFNWTVYVDALPEQLEEIESVTYVLHRTFGNRRVRVTMSRESGFPLSAVGWGEFWLKAIIRRRDKRRIVLSHCLELGFDTQVCNG